MDDHRSSAYYYYSQARRLAIVGAMITGLVGVTMSVYTVIGGEETGGAALLAASALAFGLLALSLDRRATSSSAVAAAEELIEDATNGANPSHAGPLAGIGPTGLPLDVSHINGSLVIRPRQTDVAVIEADPITDREREVLSLVAEGYSNKLISADLGISECTVKNHLTATMTKLRASDRTHAVVTAVRLGWLTI